MFHDVYNTNTNKSQNIWTSFELLVVQSNSSLITHRKRKVVQAQTYVLTRIYERSRFSGKYYTEISIIHNHVLVNKFEFIDTFYQYFQ